MSHLERPATTEDVIWLYRALLDRGPETDAVLQGMVGQPLSRLIVDFLNSEERARLQVGLMNERYRRTWPGRAVDLNASQDTLKALFDTARRTWSRLGEEEPFWSVMTHPAYRSELLDEAGKATFFETGARDLATLKDACARNGLNLRTDGRVLDFGCGVGRVGVHLAAAFDRYLGVDISPAHLAEARVRLGAVTDRADFALLDDFVDSDQTYDCVFSVLVMQHNAPPVMAELMRVLIARLRPGGVGYIQIPHVLHGYAYSAAAHLADPLPVGQMEMHALPQGEVFRLLIEGGARPVEALADGRTGTAGLSTTYLFQKN
jgi:SAM-dependent methyltransferase